MSIAYIIGLGRSGIAAARVLKTDGWEVVLSDRADSLPLQQTRQILEQEGITVKLGHELTLMVTNPPDLIVVSPGISLDIPFLIEARAQGIDVIGELELAWRYLCRFPWVGITGTNGKTTTTALTASIFQTSGLNAPSCGNIGHAACELVRSSEKFDWIIAEVSSYQGESLRKLAPKIGIWTTFTADHLDRHKTLDNYYAIKASILHRCEYKILNGDDPHLHQVGLHHWADAYWTTTKGKDHLICNPSKGIYIQDNWIVAFGELIAPLNLFKMVGFHNKQNLLMAVGAARLAGIKKDVIAQSISEFKGVPHRLELICNVRGIDFINDSKATNYDAAEVGLVSVKSPLILVAGGKVKEGDNDRWIKQIKKRVSTVLLIGEAAEIFSQELKKSGYETYEIVETLENAVKRGLELGQKQKVKVVLFSPACASFDQYQSFEHRGDHFRKLCQELS